jgi:hydroxymethylglutaryl-CoA synthase
MTSDTIHPGISGMSVYVPALRVPLETWCEWTGNSWDKVQSVVGSGFRCPGPRENVYTMAASAVLRLIQHYDVDPKSVRYLALGTETSTDNSAGAVIVRGMVDRALERLGLPRLSRALEVPELKHACLAGVYGVKGATRFLASDGKDSRAIVVCSDIAEYERGTSGEQTQGAGAVAMLLEPRARILEVDLAGAGSASDYRGPDFRKPHRRFLIEGYAESTTKLHDFPVFSGKYSTYAYLDETLAAFSEMCARLGKPAFQVLEEARAIFFHRPYQHMPISAMAAILLRALLRARPDAPELVAALETSHVTLGELAAEADASRDLLAGVEAGNADVDPMPATTKAAAQLRRSEAFRMLVEGKMSLGSTGARELGNLYTGALFAWLASGLSEASAGGDRTGERWLAVGYGSGDAAEALPLRVAPGWREAARRIAFADALASARDLTRDEYEGLHDGRSVPTLAGEPVSGFRIARIGKAMTPSFQDLGVEYYEYVRPMS